ncbi:MAG: D-hexose-6-phosphate mutarotase, partial [Planctomycetota bacterium]|jgi:D-hexose-6-phosphate mutarotase
MSGASVFEEGKPIRGGVPVCWPWFGPNDQNPDLPMHGLARTRSFGLVETTALNDGATRVNLALTDNAETRALFPHAFELRIVVTVGQTLAIEMVTRHDAPAPLPISNALHTYFRVANAADTKILGLEGCAYVDKTDGMQRKIQNGPITIDAETDRVYHHAADAVIEDPGLGRRLRIAKTGSASTVVWNPWVEKARAMPDFGDDEFPAMLCVETANALDDTLTVPPRTDHRMCATISVEPLD